MLEVKTNIFKVSFWFVYFHVSTYLFEHCSEFQSYSTRTETARLQYGFLKLQLLFLTFSGKRFHKNGIFLRNKNRINGHREYRLIR